jgi:hypothetical protein
VRHSQCRITLVLALDILLVKIPLLLRQLLAVLSVVGFVPGLCGVLCDSACCLFSSDPFLRLPTASTLGFLVGRLSTDFFCWFLCFACSRSRCTCRCIPFQHRLPSLFSALCYSLPCFRDNFPACFTGFLTVTRLAILIFPPKFQGVMWCGSVY